MMKSAFPAPSQALEGTRPAMSPVKWVDVEQLIQAVKEELGYSPAVTTIIGWRKAGCPHLPISYRRIRYNAEEVISWVLEREVKGKAWRPKRALGKRLG